MTIQYQLPKWHSQALEWFELHAGQEFDQRPFDVGLPIKLTSLQRGIWKPAATPYAVSVVQTHKGVYEDQDPVFFEDGTWRYFYHQEGKKTEDLRDPESFYTNAGLFKCWKDSIPVGVIIPAERGRGYQVLGLALVESYSAGYFGLVGPVEVSAISSAAGVAEQKETVSVALVDMPLGTFDPNAEEDSRLKVVAAVHRRQGAPRFRRALITAYQGQCAMTRYDAPAALEAAHIVPYRGPQTNHPTNGLLLRADMHDLFDLGLLAVDASMRLLVAEELQGTKYEHYADARLWLPREAELQPNSEALEKHRQQSRVA